MSERRLAEEIKELRLELVRMRRAFERTLPPETKQNDPVADRLSFFTHGLYPGVADDGWDGMTPHPDGTAAA